MNNFNISNISSWISILQFLLTVVLFLSARIVTLINKYRKIPTNIRKGLKYYINTRGQFEDPCNEAEIKNSRVESFPLMEYFVNQINNEKDQKYYLILGDSGMGKSTFLAKLFLNRNFKIKHKIYYYNLMDIDNTKVKNELNGIKRKSKSIILLDGFDENTEAVKNYYEKIIEIEERTKNFYKIIITSRTQFFINEREEPSQVSVALKTKSNFQKYIKIYLSPFNNNEINTYIKKVFKNQIDQQKVKFIIKKCNNLMVRPMLLSYIKDLLYLISENNITINDIYKKLIDEWIKKEGISGLYDFLLDISNYIYRNNKLYLTREEINLFSQRFNFNNEVFNAVRGRNNTLLNRDKLGHYKFAHKSVLEYLITLNLLNTNNDIIMDITNYEMCKIFFMNYLEKEEYFYSIILLSGINFNSNEIKKVIKEIIFTKDINNCLFYNVDLSNLNLELNCNNSIFINVNFSNSLMKNCRFRNSSFNNINFEKSDLSNSIFDMVKFEKVNFKDTVLIMCTFPDSDLSNTNVYNARTSGDIWNYFIKLSKMIRIYSKEAQNGNKNAIVMLSTFYCTYKGVYYNEELGLNWLFKLGSTGVSLAENFFDNNFISAEGLINFFIKLEEVAPSSYNEIRLAKLYYNHLFNRIQYEYWIKKAAENGNSEALYIISFNTNSFRERLKYLKLASKQGSMKANRDLAYYYFIKGNFSMSKKFNIKAIKQGYEKSLLSKVFEDKKIARISFYDKISLKYDFEKKLLYINFIQLRKIFINYFHIFIKILRRLVMLNINLDVFFWIKM